MKAPLRSGLIAAALFLLALLAGCGSTNTSKSAPTVEEAFYVHSVVFGNNSTLLSAGYNAFGQLGLGTLESPDPYSNPPLGLGRVRGYAAGANHTLAFTNNSSIYAWGSNLHGRLGINQVGKFSTSGSDAYVNVPVRIRLPAPIVSIATGWNHSLAVAGPAGTAYAWGANNFGQVGNNGLNKESDQPFPEPVVGPNATGTLDGVVQVAAGGSHSLALRADGTVWSWGYNEFGQLGYKTLPLLFSLIPQQVTFPGTTRKVVQIAAAGSFSAALMDDGTVWAWGYNVYGQCGSKPIINQSLYLVEPTQVKNADGTPFLATKISLGTMHVMAIRADSNLASTGEVWGWGWNEKAQLGLSHQKLDANGQPVLDLLGKPVIVDDDSLASYLPERATALDLIAGTSGFATDIYAFGTVSFARIDGKLYGWGDNGFGQLGQPIPPDAIPLIFVPVEFKQFGT